MALPKYRKPRGWRKERAEEKVAERAKGKRPRKDGEDA